MGIKMRKTGTRLVLGAIALSALVSICEVGDAVAQGFTEGVKREIPNGCAGPRTPATNEATLLANALCSGLDVLAKAKLTKSSSTTVTYSETAEFELALHRSLKAKHPYVMVDLTSAKISREEIDVDQIYADSPRITGWIAALKGRGGKVIACQEQVPEMFWALDWLLKAVVSGLDKWVTYRPLKNYNGAALVYAPDAMGQGALKSVVFVRKDKPLECPANSLPLKAS
jgi:hypothetical protein